MDQSKLPELVEDEILKRLPDEAIDLLAELSEDGEDHEAEIAVIFKRYGIDPKAVAEEILQKGAANE